MTELIQDALLDVCTHPNLTPFRANAILREHGVHRAVKALEPTDKKLWLGIAGDSGAIQWSTLDTVTSTLGL